MKSIAEALGFGVLFLVLALLWFGVMSGKLHAEDPRIDLVVKVRHQQTYDSHGIQFFTLVTPDGEALLSVDGDLPLAHGLHQFVNKRVRLTMEDAEPKRLDR